MTNHLKVGKKRIRNAAGGGAGSASDVDGGAGSGGDMSEGGKNKKLKLNPAVASSRNGTPQGSRPGSPTPVHAGGGGATKGKRLTILLWLFSEMLQLWHTKSVMVRRSNSSLNPSTHRSTKFPNPCRNPCCDPSIGHSQQRPAQDFPSSPWRF